MLEDNEFSHAPCRSLGGAFTSHQLHLDLPPAENLILGMAAWVCLTWPLLLPRALLSGSKGRALTALLSLPWEPVVPHMAGTAQNPAGS